MNEPSPIDNETPQAVASDRRHRWDALGVIIASVVGLLALLVSGYTANIQRQQVRAQVWPYLSKAYVDPVRVDENPYSLAIFNKGVGPAIVKSVQVSVDGKSRATWGEVFDALGLPSDQIQYSSIEGTVLSPGETLPIVVLKDKPTLAHFRQAMSTRAQVRICFCSTLGECWMLADQKAGKGPDVTPIAECPRLTPSDTFTN